MAKISLRVFKKGKPLYWIIGAVIVFVLFYMLFNKGAPAKGSAGGGVVVQQTGPSEAAQMAALQASTALQGAQISAGIELARVQSERDAAALGAQVALAQLGSGEKVALASLDADKFAANLNAQTNLLINEQNLNYSAESARIASETQLGLRALDVSMFEKQLDTNAEMFKEQSRNLIAQTALSQVSSLKKKNRDEALTAIYSSASGTPNTYVAQSGGGFGLGDIVGVIASPIASAIH